MRVLNLYVNLPGSFTNAAWHMCVCLPGVRLHAPLHGFIRHPSLSFASQAERLGVLAYPFWSVLLRSQSSTSRRFELQGGLLSSHKAWMP